MKEFRSTEILDKEIQEDARRKAEKLLKRADIDGQRIIDETEDRIKEVEAEKKNQYAERVKNYGNNLEASLPLEKERFLVSFQNQTIIDAIKAYISALSEKQREQLVEKLLIQYKPFLNNKKFSAQYTGFSGTIVQTLLEKNFGKKMIAEITERKKTGADFEEGLYIETEDKTVMCRATIAELVHSIIDTNRFELANTLFSGRFEQ
ncbi:MAG: hypothetical protein J6Y75_04850 [Spirochaetaceae bacterium]|nr:hypothetical protein [Spirochaetaceae bacterium]